MSGGHGGNDVYCCQCIIKTVWAAAEQVIEYDPNQEEKTHPGSIILKQNLKEEDLPSLKQPEASYTDENGIHYRLADWEVRELPEASRSRMLEKRKCTGR